MKNKGMSLIEILIGVMLLALLLVPALNAILTKTQTVGATRDHAQAAFAAQMLIEECRSYPFDLIEEDHHGSNNEMKAKTFEHLLRDPNNPKIITLNGVDYRVDPEKTSIDGAISSYSGEDTLPAVWLFKLKLDYNGIKPGQEHTFEIYTAISQRE